MDLGLAGKVAFIAGGSQGLGKAVALEMSREGAKVVICALDDPELPQAVEDIKAATGGEIIGVPADVTDAGEARDFIRKGLEHFETIDILVNNA
ncbi:MAG TPA: 3-oxoacyl-ACP reductase, partial [Syntrophobacteraceae bacterium]|nr:3-oxoacyl-ACP reductase [Syntrophobacteraceae bacterium]